MKTWQSGLRAGLPLACLAALLAFSGCEETDEDRSGVDAYLAANPYTSALPRDTPLPTELLITPLNATVAMVGQAVAFTASGGNGSFFWGVSDPANGTIASSGADQAIYTCRVVGNNDVIVQDDGGHYAVAHISPVAADAMALAPAAVTLSAGALNASFAVSGGTPPYSWTSGNSALGVVSYSAGSSYVAAYSAVPGAYGQNVITVIDANGRTVSATVTQQP